MSEKIYQGEITGMTAINRQQIIISGVGGQGVLFVTRILAEVAIQKGFHVLTSETHGMAQRGGSVVSHLKVGNYTSPLIRPGNADGMIALKEEAFYQYEIFLKPGGWAVVNCKKNIIDPSRSIYCLDADSVAQKHHALKSINLIILGYTAAIGQFSKNSDENRLFCSIDEIKSATELIRLDNTQIAAINIGYTSWECSTDNNQ